MHTDQKIKKTKKRTPLISLVGQPNSGKTTLFNFLSGKNYKTVNYPGSTVEYSISKILSKYSIDANILDSPGIISLVPASPDEKISISSLHSHPEFGTPDLIIVTVDSSQLSRHLLLVKQLIDSGFNVIVALTMKDILHKKGFDISEKRLGEMLGCIVVSVDGKTGKGIDNLLKQVNDNIGNAKIGREISLQRLPHNLRKESLLESYREIESIEKEVLYSKSSLLNNEPVNLAKINEQLVVLNPGRTQNLPDAQSMKLDSCLLYTSRCV